MSSTDFYRAFEERHRGSRELIRTRLQAYQPFITPLTDIFHPANAIDLGCGRGEWVELLQGAGFEPQGVDLDASMLAACTERGLPVAQGDAIGHLKSLTDESQCIVSGFHIAEHIAFDDLNTLVQQALRVLKPGGLLILETPNPENIVVGTTNFYLDPTHLRPIPPLLLSFLPEYHGFARVRTVRLQESPELHHRSDIWLMDVLGGASPDYAIVAQKAADAEILARFEAAFAAPYGIELRGLAERYDNTLSRRIGALDQRLSNVEAQVGGMTDALDRIATSRDRLLEACTELARKMAEFEEMQGDAARAFERIEQTESHARAMESRVQEHQQRATGAEALAQRYENKLKQQMSDMDKLIDLCSQLASKQIEMEQQRMRAAELKALEKEQQIKALEAQINALAEERNALLQSWSWRITAPARWCVKILLALTPKSFKSYTKQLIQRVALYVARRPQISQAAISILDRAPLLKKHIKSIVDAPQNASIAAPNNIPRTFENLKSSQIMAAVADAADEKDSDSIIFLKVVDHGK